MSPMGNGSAQGGGAASGVQHYTAFGEVRSRGGEMPTVYQYTGQLSQMEEVGLYHYGARWYDPAGAHFTQADTLIPELYNPLDVDRYAYGRGNPLKYTDPTGHMVACDGNVGNGCDGFGVVSTYKVEEEFGVLVDQDISWSNEQLKSVYVGLSLFRNVVGEKSFNNYVQNQPAITIGTSAFFSEWNNITNRINVSVDGSWGRLTGATVHELFHAILDRSGKRSELAEIPFMNNIGWQLQATNRCFLWVFCKTTTQYINPGDGPTPYSRGDYGNEKPDEDAAETFMIMSGVGIPDRPITEERRKWFYWVILELAK